MAVHDYWLTTVEGGSALSVCRPRALLRRLRDPGPGPEPECYSDIFVYV